MPLERDLDAEPGCWEFDAAVADGFDDMLARSIPQLATMRELVSDVAARHVRPGLSVLDLGCSRGDALAGVLDRLDLAEYRYSGSRFVGVEVSAPMRDAAARLLAGRGEVLDHDLRTGVPNVGPCGAVLSVLTLQFVPIEHRQRVVDGCRERLAPGGVLLLVEKVLGATARIDDEMVAAYYATKLAAGYSTEEIDRKRLSLEGVLVPITAAWNEQLLRAAGFTAVDCFWRWMNFAGWVAHA